MFWTNLPDNPGHRERGLLETIMNPKGRVLIVDDNAVNVDILRRILRKEYDLETAAHGEECLAKIPAFKPQLVLLDIMMPGIDGYETCRRIKSSTVGPLVQVILVSGKGSTAERLQGYAAQADDYVVKPFDHDELLSKARVHLRLAAAQRQLAAAKEELEIYANDLERLVARRTQQWAATQDMTVFALAQLTDSRDPETGAHICRIRYYAQTLAERLQESGPYQALIDERFLKDLYRSSPLHDIGKVAVPDAILQKPGKLAPEEFELIKQHVRVGGDTLENARNYVGQGTFMDMAADIARYPHERYDGSGYCAGLRGEEIPLSARIVALADVYDALSSPRIYKPAYEPDHAREIILGQSGAHFDPAIVDAFTACFDKFQLGGGDAGAWVRAPVAPQPVEVA
jgi:putative two-component system response regulator